MNDQEMTTQVESIVARLLDLLDMHATIQVDIQELEGKKYLDIHLEVAEGGAELIGQRGRTLDSLAVVISMMLPKTEEKYSVLLDVNEYRSERSKQVEEMAHKAAMDAIETNRTVELTPMRPWERRVVHVALKERTDIITESIGEDPERRVVVRPS